jgi:DNA-binding transcriptional ArsR family regulator
MEEGIVLDRKSFEALAVDTRVRLLKSLRERRKTLSELSEELGMSVSGVKEHLQILEQAELVQKMDEGRKWKYYQLTKKGSGVVAPKELKVWILLSVSSMALIMSVMALFYGMQPVAAQPDVLPSVAAAPELKTTALGVQDEDTNATSRALPPGGAHDIAVDGSDLGVPMAVAGISATTLIACLAVLWRNRFRTKA